MQDILKRMVKELHEACFKPNGFKKSGGSFLRADGVARQRAEAMGTPFGAVVAKLLRRRDAYRYASAREVWEDLRQLPAWRERNLFPIR